MQTRARVTSRSRFIAKRRTGSAIDIVTTCPVFTSNTTANGSLAFSGHTANVDTFNMTLFGGTIVSVNGNSVNNTTYNGTITNLLNTTFVLNVPLNGNYVLEISSSRSIDVICAGDGPRPAANIAFSCPSSGNFDGFDIAEGTFTFTSHTNTDTFTLNMTGGTISTINGIPVNSNTYTGNVVGSMIPFTILVPIDTNYTLNLTTSKGAQFNCAGTGGVSTPPQLVLNGGDLIGNDLNFPDTVINTTSNPLTFDISGTFVNFPITIVSNSPRFVVDTPSIPAPMGGILSATSIGVTFNPTAVQVYNSTITITCGPTVETINLNGSGIGVCALSNMVAGTSPHSIAFAFDTPPAFNTGTLGIKRTNLVNFFNQTVTDTSSPHQFLGIQPDQDYDWRTTIDCGGSPVVVNSDPIIHTEPIPCEYGLSGNIEAVFATTAILNVQYPQNSNSLNGTWQIIGDPTIHNFTINSPSTVYIIDFSSENPPIGSRITVQLWDSCNISSDKITLNFYCDGPKYFRFSNIITDQFIAGTTEGLYPTSYQLLDADNNNVLVASLNVNANDQLQVTGFTGWLYNVREGVLTGTLNNTVNNIHQSSAVDQGKMYSDIIYEITSVNYPILKDKNLKVRINSNALYYLPSTTTWDTPIQFIYADSVVFRIDPNMPYGVTTPLINFTYNAVPGGPPPPPPPPPLGVPTITGASPSGVQSFGTMITVTGTNFISAGTLNSITTNGQYSGGAPAIIPINTISVNSETELTFILATSSNSREINNGGPITINWAGGTDSTSGYSVSVIYNPLVTSINPDPVVNGNTTLINGFNFLTQFGCRFTSIKLGNGGVDCPIMNNSETFVSVLIPPGTAPGTYQFYMDMISPETGLAAGFYVSPIPITVT